MALFGLRTSIRAAPKGSRDLPEQMNPSKDNAELFHE
jgi:hypothetical protein